MKSSQELKELLIRIDHRGYPAYKDTRGSYQFPGYVLSIDHVQGDPFASPSKISIQLAGAQARFPSRLYDRPWKRTALCDTLLRSFSRQIEHFTFKAKGSGKSGLIGVSRCGQEILDRSACTIDPQTGNVHLRLEIGFPANGRTINSGELIKIFYDFLPVCVQKALLYTAYAPGTLDAVMELSENQQAIRGQLTSLGLCAFVANGAILPRESGISQRPMKNAVPFRSPASMEVTLTLPYGGSLSGMGIPKGVTLIVGGGYHGKSTLLEALERGVYNHIAGDGREYVITDDSAMKIRAEDGRSIRHVDISMFINDLPNKKDTSHFDTEDASGSTSQAANVVEAMEAGAALLLIDEDTSASNFMVRDALMESVVSRSCEPITPLIHRIRQLYEQWGISSIVVAGSSGAFFEKADCIIQMDRYEPVEITAFAKEKARLFAAVGGTDTAARGAAKTTAAPETAGGGAAKTAAISEATGHEQSNEAVKAGRAPKAITAPTLPAHPADTERAARQPDFSRRPKPSLAQAPARGTSARDNHSSSGGAARFRQTGESGKDRGDRVKIKVNGRDSLSLNRENIDLRYVEQLVDTEQLMTLGYLVAYASKHFIDGRRTLAEVVDLLEQAMTQKGLACICESSYLPSGLALPRRQEIFACFNRYRGLRI